MSDKTYRGLGNKGLYSFRELRQQGQPCDDCRYSTCHVFSKTEPKCNRRENWSSHYRTWEFPWISLFFLAWLNTYLVQVISLGKNNITVYFNLMSQALVAQQNRICIMLVSQLILPQIPGFLSKLFFFYPGFLLIYPKDSLAARGITRKSISVKFLMQPSSGQEMRIRFLQIISRKADKKWALQEVFFLRQNCQLHSTVLAWLTFSGASHFWAIAFLVLALFHRRNRWLCILCKRTSWFSLPVYDGQCLASEKICRWESLGCVNVHKCPENRRDFRKYQLLGVTSGKISRTWNLSWLKPVVLFLIFCQNWEV